jgi:hypothetical protein
MLNVRGVKDVRALQKLPLKKQDSFNFGFDVIHGINYKSHTIGRVRKLGYGSDQNQQQWLQRRLLPLD